MTPNGLVLDLFAGPRPGGWDEGLRLAGHRGPVVGIEWCPAACATAQAAGHQRIRADVATYPLAPLVGKVTGLIASPPCPSWSMAGNGAGKLDVANVLSLIGDYATGRAPGAYDWVDERSALTAQPMRYVAALRPAWVACEQVPPVLPIWRWTAHQLRKLGYSAWCGLLSSEAYGVPQTRLRAFLIASLTRLVARPAPTHQRYRAGRTPDTAEGLFDPLPPPVSMAEALGFDGVDRPARTVAGNRLRSNYGVGGDPTARGHRDLGQPSPTVTGKVDRNRWMAPAGATSEMVEPRPDTDPAHTLTGQGSAAWVRHRPATTVCGDPRVGRPGHKDRDRGESQFGRDSVRVTVTEAGILQSFRADYPWRGTQTQRHRMVGDAVPPLLAAAVLRQVLPEAS